MAGDEREGRGDYIVVVKTFRLFPKWRLSETEDRVVEISVTLNKGIAMK